MLEIKGKFNSAKVFADIIDEVSIEQIKNLCNQPFADGAKIRLMPDVHAGAGCTIGTTMTITDKIIPNLVGVDIGCGMETVKLCEKDISLPLLDKVIHERIPAGFNIREEPNGLYYTMDDELKTLKCADKVNYIRASRSLGTLGGGNHFIEADKDEDGNIYIVIHSGSRHLGVEVASYYQSEGYRRLNGASKKDIFDLIATLKEQGRQREIESSIIALKKRSVTNIPKDLAYVADDLFEDYIHDMKIIQKFAMLNRKAMMSEIVDGMGFHISEGFTTIHNYVDTDNMILRKGAVSAQRGEKLLIPINMRDGSLICIGKGNEDWNCSAPHGAGRLMSRNEARRSFTVDEFEKNMEGIYSTSINENTIDECPMVYKSMEDIVNNISDTVDIVSVIKPIYNFKASEEEY